MTLSSREISITQVVYNSNWLLFERFARALVTLFITAWVARYLGPKGFGIYSYALAYIMFFQSLSLLGLDGIVVRDLTQNRAREMEILGAVFRGRFIWGWMLWILSVLIMSAIAGPSSDKTIYTAITGAVLVFQSSEAIDLFFQSKSESRKTVKIKVATLRIGSFLKIQVIYFEGEIIHFFMIFLIEYIIISSGLLYTFNKESGVSKLGGSLQTLKPMVKESWPFIISGMSILLYMRLDIFFIEFYLGLDHVGLYSAILPFSAALSILPMVLTTSLGPYIAAKKKTSEDSYLVAIRNLNFIFFWVLVVLCICIFFSSTFIVDLFLGEDYQKAAAPLMVHVFSNIFIGLGLAQNLWILNEKKSIISLGKALVVFVIFVISNYILIKKYVLNFAAY